MLPTRVWWHSFDLEPAEERIKKLLKNIKQINENLLIIDKPIKDDIINFKNTSFVTECLIAEKNIAFDKNITPYDQVEGILETPNKLSKINNLFNATCYILNNNLSFDLSLMFKIHELIGKGFIEDAGSFRTCCVSGAQSTVKYSNPEDVDEMIKALFTKIKFKKDLFYMIETCSCFYADFLLIHPFSNGNGRVVRILVAFLLLDFSITPLSLFLDNNPQIFLSCVQEAQREPKSYESLILLILDCLERHINNLLYLTDDV